MKIEPRMRGFICLTSHPTGCEKNVSNQKSTKTEKTPSPDGTAKP